MGVENEVTKALSLLERIAIALEKICKILYLESQETIGK